MYKQWLIILVIFQFFRGSLLFTGECYYQMTTLDTLGYLYECFGISNTDPVLSNHNVTYISGQHVSGLSNWDVKSVHVKGYYNLTFFPRGFTNFFPNITAFIIHNADIDRLNGNELDEFGSKLQYFTMAFGNLRTISSRLFEPTPNVIVTQIYSNYRLSRVGRNLFNPLHINNVKWISTRDNLCIDRSDRDQAYIRYLINDIKFLCPYDHEVMCYDGEIDELACDLKQTVEKVQLDLKNGTEVLRTSIGRLENELIAVNARTDGLQSKLDEQKLKLNQTDERLQAAIADQQNTKATVAEIQGKLESSVERLEKGQNMTNLRIDGLQSDLNAQQIQLTQMDGKLQDTVDKFEIIDVIVTEIKEELSTSVRRLDNEFIAINLRTDGLQSKIDEQQLQINQTNEKLEAATVELQNTKANVSEIHNKLEVSVERFENGLNMTNLRIDGLQAELNAQQIQLTQVDGKLQDTNDELENFRAIVTEMHEEHTTSILRLENELIAANERTDGLQTKLDEQQIQLTETDEKLQDTVNELDDTKVIVAELQEQLNAKDEIIKDIQNQLETSTEIFQNIINEQESRLQWLEFEVLKLTTNPCHCNNFELNKKII